jgi:hypothetical protein
MALRLVFAWIGINLGALLLLALVDLVRVAGKGVFRRVARGRRLEKAPT